jgi:NADH-quinone oxidoreductase subunit F
VAEVIVLAGADDGDLTQLDAYREAGGYVQLERARGMAGADVIEELNTANLRGRGGAFFSTGTKMKFIPSKEQNPKPHYVCVNADESEPGTFKDREIMNRVPHRLIEGSLIAAHAIDSQNVFIYIRGEYLDAFETLRAALDQARDADLLGGVTVVLHRGAGA